MKWKKEEIEDLKLGYSIGLKHKEIAEVLGRTSSSVKHKAERLNIPYIAKVWYNTDSYNNKLTDMYLCEEYISYNVKVVHKCSICNHKWKATPNNILGKGSKCPQCAIKNKRISKEEYLCRIPKDIILLEEYIGYQSKILHKHIKCGHTWKVLPKQIVSGHGCPRCNRSYDYTDNPTFLYIVYFKSIDLYKIGITIRDIKKRFSGYPEFEIIYLKLFNNGEEAYIKEGIWLAACSEYLINTQLLSSGNTETLRI